MRPQQNPKQFVYIAYDLHFFSSFILNLLSKHPAHNHHLGLLLNGTLYILYDMKITLLTQFSKEYKEKSADS